MHKSLIQICTCERNHKQKINNIRITHVKKALVPLQNKQQKRYTIVFVIIYVANPTIFKFTLFKEVYAKNCSSLNNPRNIYFIQ